MVIDMPKLTTFTPGGREAKEALEAVNVCAEKFKVELQAILDGYAGKSEEERLDLDAAAEFMKTFHHLEKLKQFSDAADRDGIPVGDWIIDKLSEAIDPNTCHLPIRRDIYEKFARIANMRGCSLDVLGKGGLMSDWLTKAVDNGRV